MGMFARARWAAACSGLGVVLLVGACGTTVPLGAQTGQDQQAGGIGGTGQASGGLGSTSGQQAAVGGGGASSSTGTGTGAGGEGSTAAPGAGDGAGVGPRGGSSGSGTAVTTTKPLELGFIVTACSNCHLLGGQYANAGGGNSGEDVLRALVNHQNKIGGINGRKINPVFADIDTNAPNWPTMFQAVCSTFTQDHHVAAVLGVAFVFDQGLMNCLTKAGIPWINSAAGLMGDDTIFAKYPTWFSTMEPTQDAQELVAFTSAWEDGWLTPKSVVGMLDQDCAADERVYTRTLVPWMRTHHVTMKAHEVASCTDGSSKLGENSAFLQNAVLKMRSAGVDTVVVSGIALLLFSENAESQNYRPKYLAYSGLAGGEGIASPNQMVNMHAADWIPTRDFDSTHQQPQTPEKKACVKDLVSGGLSTAPSEYPVYYAVCSNLALYVAAAKAAPTLTATGIAAAIGGLGSSFGDLTLLTQSSSWGPRKHFGPTSYRVSTYNEACSCFLYTGGVRPLPVSGH